MAGIYLHIPFCKQACHYCDFHFSTSIAQKQSLLDALRKELYLQKDYLEGKTVETIYFGGGTPSVLSGDEITRILGTVFETFEIGESPEITLEANPDDLSREKLHQLRKSGVNRLSIGIQSFRDRDLRWMNRAHSAEEADYSVKAAQDAGLSNITIDLIYGIPDLTMVDWKKNLHTAFDLGVQHISAYCLTIEPKTVFGKQASRGNLRPVDDEVSGNQFIAMTEMMESAGYEQYEVSNFSLPGFRSKHNTSYWLGKHYLGIGPSAHSFNGKSRQWNVSNNPVYTREISAGRLPFELEILDERTRVNEYLMTGLRTSAGIDTDYISSVFGIDLRKVYSRMIESLIDEGKLISSAHNLRLTTRGFLVADRIASDFFILENE